MGVAVKLENLSKFYKLYNSPKQRLKEAIHPLKKRYHRRFFALNNLNLSIKKGEILGIVGNNGSGKSTLLKLISGITQPSSGKVTVNGKVSLLLELGTGLNPDLTGIQNIIFSGTLKGFSKGEINERMEAIISFAGIGNFIHQPLKVYSSGMKARLGFALAINMNPDILIVDEVLAVGDELFRRKCYAKMEEFFKSGCTVLYVSHNLNTINEICTKAILVDRGEIILEGAPKLVTMNYRKYLYTKSKDISRVRNEILLLNKDKEKKNFFSINIKNQAVIKPGVNRDVGLIGEKEDKMPSKQESYFIPDLKSKSKSVIKNYNVNICDNHIRNLEGGKVNSLVMYEEYIYSYKVEFGETIEHINFGMGFKNEKGTPLSWMIYPGVNQYLNQKISEGDCYLLDWHFKCLFIPGIYYIDSGLRTLRKNDAVIVVKIADSMAFKVQKIDVEQKGGIFDTFTTVKIRKI
jgi:lipopolysaccharide transport system ATP-binding protein